MSSHIVSRVVSSVVSIPDENDPKKFNTYNIFADQANGHCILLEGKVVNIDTLKPSKGKAFLEGEILRVTIAIQELTKTK